MGWVWGVCPNQVNFPQSVTDGCGFASKKQSQQRRCITHIMPCCCRWIPSVVLQLGNSLARGCQLLLQFNQATLRPRAVFSFHLKVCRVCSVLHLQNGNFVHLLITILLQLVIFSEQLMFLLYCLRQHKKEKLTSCFSNDSDCPHRCHFIHSS